MRVDTVGGDEGKGRDPWTGWPSIPDVVGGSTRSLDPR